MCGRARGHAPFLLFGQEASDTQEESPPRQNLPNEPEPTESGSDEATSPRPTCLTRNRTPLCWERQLSGHFRKPREVNGELPPDKKTKERNRGRIVLTGKIFREAMRRDRI